MKALPLTTTALSALCFTLSACGGGSDVQSAGNVPVVTPNPSSSPAPTPLAAPTNPLLTPVQTASPSAVYATGLSPTLKASGGALTLPLLVTAVENNFSGDLTTTNQGATLNVAADGSSNLKINNPTWNLPPPSPSGDGLTVHKGPYFASLDLDYTTFGNWYATSSSKGTSYYVGGGVWLGGLQTPVGAMPLLGSATYAGNVNGEYSLYSKCTCADFGILGGNVAMTANFATGAISGRMTNLLVVDGTGFNDPLNDILFSASIAGGSSRFVGTTSVSGVPRAPSGVGVPSGNVGLQLNATGTIVGGFFGPTAQEAGAVWTIDDGKARVIGSFGAKTGGN